VFDINGPEFLVLGAVALFVLGPDKLPGYAAQASRLLRQLRTMADGAKEQVREQLGPEFDDVDWKSLDPRQYDPRRIVRDALSGADDDREDRPEKPVSPGAPRPVDETLADEAGGGRPAQPATYDEDAT
jgi:sec-independent protein translocase protein TatB